MKDATTFRNWKRLEFATQQEYERDSTASDAAKRRLDYLRPYMSSDTRPRGKIATRRRELDITSDRRIALAISEVFRSGGAVRLHSQMEPGVRYYGINTSLKNTDIKLNSKIRFVEDIDPDTISIHVPRWKDTGDYLKTVGWLLGAIKHFGHRARPFTLNLSQDVIQKAATYVDGFSSYLQKALKRNLSRAYAKQGITTPPEFFFWVEAHKIERPHLHGVIIFPSEASALPVYRAIRTALRLSGGEWTGPGHQLVIKTLKPSNPYGWGWYISKLKETSQLHIRNLTNGVKTPSLVAVTSGLNRLSKDAYENARQRGEILSG